eukprot:496210-Pyramimonas_sp.AAC.1
MRTIWRMMTRTRRDEDEVWKRRRRNKKSYPSYFEVLHREGLVMSEHAREEAYDHGCLFLNCYQYLAGENMRLKKCLYTVKPKLHHLCHVVDYHLTPAIDPRWLHNFQDGDFNGRIARLCGRVHVESAMIRCFQ